MAVAILRNLSSCGSLRVLTLSLSAKNCLFFFLGGASVSIAHLILPVQIGAGNVVELTAVTETNGGCVENDQVCVHSFFLPVSNSRLKKTAQTFRDVEAPSG